MDLGQREWLAMSIELLLVWWSGQDSAISNSYLFQGGWSKMRLRTVVATVESSVRG